MYVKTVALVAFVATRTAGSIESAFISITDSPSSVQSPFALAPVRQVQDVNSNDEPGCIGFQFALANFSGTANTGIVNAAHLHADAGIVCPEGFTSTSPRIICMRLHKDGNTDNRYYGLVEHDPADVLCNDVLAGDVGVPSSSCTQARYGSIRCTSDADGQEYSGAAVAPEPAGSTRTVLVYVGAFLTVLATLVCAWLIFGRMRPKMRGTSFGRFMGEKEMSGTRSMRNVPSEDSSDSDDSSESSEKDKP